MQNQFSLALDELQVEFGRYLCCFYKESHVNEIKCIKLAYDECIFTNAFFLLVICNQPNTKLDFIW